jgi:hypothetical protein
MKKSGSQTPFERLKEAMKQILSTPKKDLPIKPSANKKAKAAKSSS